MPMNEYGEIVRNSPPHSTQSANNGGSNNNGNTSSSSSGFAILIGIAILVAVILFIVSTAPTVSNPSYSENTTTPSIEQNTDYVSFGYILPHSNSEYITFSDLENLSKQEVILARNEIYARRGRAFKTQYIQEYFDAQPWYNPIYDSDDFPVSIFNEYENENINIILEYEKAQGWK